MTTSLVLRQSKQASTAVSQSFQEVLASTYAVFLATHNGHWNVEGERFYQLHKLFEEQYNELFVAVDALAERIRALGEYALPFEIENLALRMPRSHHGVKEGDAQARSDWMILSLITLNESVIKCCQTAKKVARDMNDDESENMLVERVAAHQKAIWMLQSVIK